MATQKLYLASPALVGEATITDIRDQGRIVRLDRTLFHPKGGGQQADQGWIGGIRVENVSHAELGEVDHQLAVGATLEVGAVVELQVNAAVRRRNSMLHSAGHLIAEIATLVEPGIKAVQGHHWPGEARVEFEGELKDPEAFQAGLQNRLDEVVTAGRSMTVVGDPYVSRAMRIDGFAPVGCGGTHVADAGNLKGLVIESAKMKKGRLRVSYTLPV